MLAILRVQWPFLLLADGSPDVCGGDEIRCQQSLQTSVRSVRWGAEVSSARDLFDLTEPVRLRGFPSAVVEAAQLAWSESAITRSLQTTRLTSRAGTPGSGKILRYRNHDVFSLPGFGERLQLSKHAYDNWKAVNKSLSDILYPGNGLVESCKIDNPDLMDLGSATSRESLVNLVNEVCPQGVCSFEDKHVKLATGLWMASAGLHWQLHFDEDHTIFFHLGGQKTFVLVPPEDMLEHSYLSPFLHPAHRNSQLRWSDLSDGIEPTSEQLLMPDADLRLEPYALREFHALLQPGDVLFIPKYWGHHTITSQGSPSISFATVWRRPEDSTERLEDELFLTMSTFIKEVSLKADSAKDFWAAVRGGTRLLVALSLRSEVRAFLDLWLEQRWKLQFHAWGLKTGPNGDASSLAIPASFCMPPSRLEASHKKTLEKMLAILREMAQRGGTLKRLMLRASLANVLDCVPFFAFSESRFRLRELDKSHSRAEVAGFLLRSIGGCGHDEVSAVDPAAELTRFKAFVDRRDLESGDKEDVKRLRALLEMMEAEKNKEQQEEMIYKATSIMDAWNKGFFGAAE